MSKITIVNSDINVDKYASAIKIGTVFTGAIGRREPKSLFIACYNMVNSDIPLIVDMNHPRKIWARNPIISNYHEVNIKIIIEE